MHISDHDRLLTHSFITLSLHLPTSYLARNRRQAKANEEITYRPIINKRNLHHSLEHTLLDLLPTTFTDRSCDISFSNLRNEMVIEGACAVGKGGSVEGGFIAFVCGGVECELRY